MDLFLTVSERCIIQCVPVVSTTIDWMYSYSICAQKGTNRWSLIIFLASKYILFHYRKVCRTERLMICYPFFFPKKLQGLGCRRGEEKYSSYINSTKCFYPPNWRKPEGKGDPRAGLGGGGGGEKETRNMVVECGRHAGYEQGREPSSWGTGSSRLNREKTQEQSWGKEQFICIYTWYPPPPPKHVVSRTPVLS